MKRKAGEYILMFLILSPLLFINIRSSHDWGDDFAGYITEAQNIAQGKPFYETKMVPQDYAPAYAPHYYSYGFPLLLAPVIKCFGANFKALDIYMSMWLVLWALLIFYYLRLRFSFILSASFVFIFFINPWFFRFKTEIISDIPFSFFFTLCMLLFLLRRELSLVFRLLFGFVIAFTIGIKNLGLLFPAFILLGMMVDALRAMTLKISKNELIESIKGSSIVLASCGVFIFIFSGLLFKSPGSQLGHFVSLYTSPSYWNTFIFNIDVYTRLFEQLFRHNVGKYTFALYYSTAFMLVMFTLGVIRLFLTWDKWELLLLITYGLLIMLFPFSTQGFRYLLPVLPIMILCVICGARLIVIPFPFGNYIAGFVFILFISLINVKDILAMKADQSNVLWPGPMTDESTRMFTFVKDNLPKDALIGSLKPRAVMLFTDRRTCLTPRFATAPFVISELRSVHPDYLLQIQNIHSELVNEIAAIHHDSLVWEYNGNRIYKYAKDQD